MSKKTKLLNEEYRDHNGEIEFEIVRDFGIPPRTRIAGESKYPIARMSVGDALRGSEHVVRSAALAARTYAGRNPGCKFTTRKLKDGYHVLVRTA